MCKRSGKLAGVLGVALCFLLPPIGSTVFAASGPDDWEEAEVEMPPAPKAGKLREFSVSAASSNRFFVDESSLDVGEDGVVRYVLVVETSGGASNVTFEGIRCASGQRRIYAMGHADGSWHEARRSRWEALGEGGYNQPRAALAREHFCDGRVPPRSRQEALRGLREGGRRW